MEVQTPQQQRSEEISSPVQTSSPVHPTAEEDGEIVESLPSYSSALQCQPFEPQRQPQIQTQTEISDGNSDKDLKSTTLGEDLKVDSDLQRRRAEKLEEELKAVERDTPNRRSNSKRNSGEKLRGKRKFPKQQMGNCAGSFAAVCCCPCVLAHLFVLTLVKAPVKAFRYAKRKTGIGRRKKKKTDDRDVDSSTDRKTSSFRTAWSLTATPYMSGRLEISPCRSKIGENDGDNVDPHKFWSDLYAAGHLGFGGPPHERD